MQKRRFNKKNILGIIKTYHSKKRQVERDITDAQLKKILLEGEFEDRSEHETIITLDGYHVYLSQDLEKIITVTAPDKEPSKKKIISQKDAKDIKKEIEQLKNKENHKDDQHSEISFDDYMKNEFK